MSRPSRESAEESEDRRGGPSGWLAERGDKRSHRGQDRAHRKARRGRPARGRSDRLRFAEMGSADVRQRAGHGRRAQEARRRLPGAGAEPERLRGGARRGRSGDRRIRRRLRNVQPEEHQLQHRAEPRALRSGRQGCSGKQDPRSRLYLLCSRLPLRRRSEAEAGRGAGGKTLQDGLLRDLARRHDRSRNARAHPRDARCGRKKGSDRQARRPLPRYLRAGAREHLRVARSGRENLRQLGGGSRRLPVWQGRDRQRRDRGRGLYARRPGHRNRCRPDEGLSDRAVQLPRPRARAELERRARTHAIVVDSGYGAHVPQTLALLERVLAGKKLARLVNTHCHSDHMGGNAAIQKKFGCGTSIPEGEAALVDDWDEQALILAIADQRAERFSYDDTFRDGDTLEMGGFEWQVIAAPGHDTHAVMFHSPEARVLISGDALWENGFGVVFPQLFGRDTALAETRATLEAIGRLGVDVVIPGHGRPFGDAGAALERALYRLEGYGEDVTRLARHCAKVMLSFALLEKRTMPFAGLPAYVARVPILAELNSRYFRMTPGAMAEWLVNELERAGALRRENDMLYATGS